MSSLRLQLLGSPQLEQNKEKLSLGRRKGMAILAYLAVTGRVQPREHLLALLWPDYEPTSGRANLRRDLSNLRGMIGEDRLIADREQIGLDLSAGLEVDVVQFRALLGEQKSGDVRIEALGEAIALYGGELMAGFSLRDAPAFDEWLFFERESLRGELASALEALIEHHTNQGSYEAAIDYGRRWLGLDPLHEPAQRELMWLYAWSGQQAAAIRQYEACVRILDEELGIEPEEETTALYEAIRERRLERPFAAEEPAAEEQVVVEEPSTVVEPGRETIGSEEQEVKSAEAKTAPHNLPVRATPLIGREDELAALDEMLANPEVRLVTILGPGGMGKTRLSLAAAERQLARSQLFPDGVFFVRLAPLAEPAQIPSAIAKALGIRFYSGAPAEEQLGRQLRGQKLLLVMDNFEHLVSGADLLSTILAAVPGVKLLVTSRERVNLSQEWGFDLMGLSYPSTDDEVTSEVELLDSYSGVQLFVQRARQADAHFQPSLVDLPDIIRINHLTAGMPLGLELAAAWKAVMSCAEIASEISRNLDFLASSMRDLPERHRSLRAVFRHSWMLLTEEEQGAFRRLSVFRGGFTRKAAEQVTGASLMTLGELIKKSLLRRNRQGRYKVHELLRQYAAEQLANDDREEKRSREAHALHYAGFMGGRVEDVHGARQLEVHAEIKTEFDNMRHSWGWAVEQFDWEKLDQMMEGLFEFCESSGLFQEGISLFQRAMDKLQTLPAMEVTTAQRLTLGGLCYRQGWLVGRTGSFERGANLVQQGVDLMRAAVPPAHLALAHAMGFLGTMSYFLGQVPRARQLFQEAMALAKGVEEDWLIGFVLMEAGHIPEFQGRFREANAQFMASIEAFDRTGEKRLRAYAENNQGRAAYGMGRYDEAERLIEAALAVRRESEDQIGMAYSLLDLGMVARMRGKYVEAETTMKKSLAITERIGVPDSVARCYHGLGLLQQARGQFGQATASLQRSLDIYQEIGVLRALPQTFNGLAAAALALGEFENVRRYLQKSMSISEELDNIGDKAIALNLLGRLAVAEDDRSDAGRFYKEALDITRETGAAPLALEIFVDVACLYLSQDGGRMAEARRLLSMVSAHPATTQESRDRVEALAAEWPEGSQPLPMSTAEPAELWSEVEQLSRQLANGDNVAAISDSQDGKGACVTSQTS